MFLSIAASFLISFQLFAGVGNVPKFNYNHENHTLRYRVNCKKCHVGPTSGFKINQDTCHKCHVKQDPKKYLVKNYECKTCHKNGAPGEVDEHGKTTKLFKKNK